MSGYASRRAVLDCQSRNVGSSRQARQHHESRPFVEDLETEEAGQRLEGTRPELEGRADARMRIRFTARRAITTIIGHPPGRRDARVIRSP